MEVSPLTRYINGRTRVPYPPLPTAYSVMHIRKVRRWRVILSTLREPDTYVGMEWSLVDFCSAISITPPDSIVVCFIKRGMDIPRYVDSSDSGNSNMSVDFANDGDHDGDGGDNNAGNDDGGQYNDDTDSLYDFQPFETILKPLRTLRNLKALTFRTASRDDIPDFVRRTYSPLRKACELFTFLQVLSLLVCTDTSNLISGQSVLFKIVAYTWDIPHVRLSFLVPAIKLP
jgi:hypothetical protein